MSLILSAVEQTLVFLPLVLGMYISYHILKLTDLSVDGSFVLGGVIFAKTISLGLITATIFSLLAGVIVGCSVSYMQRANKINSLLAGILTTFMLYSVNLQILGLPNVSLLNKPTILSALNVSHWIIPLSIIAIIVILFIVIILKNQLGLTLRAFGQNQKLLTILGKNIELYRTIGLAVSNSLAAGSGMLFSQMNGFVDINMGMGVALISISAIIIGLHIKMKFSKNFNIISEIIFCVLGIFTYFACLSVLLSMNINPVNLKFILGIVLYLSLTRF